MSDSVLIIAGEASSSLYAQRLIERWAADGRKLELFGIGSRDMEKLGFRCLGRSEEMAVVGLQEVVRHLPLIRKVFYDILAEVDRCEPKFALLLDYPDFNLRLAKELKKRGVRVVYYISPQVWAWRTGRVNLIRRVVDHMLVLFPFEVDFYKQHDVQSTFVGHPALDELPKPKSSDERNFQRQRFGFQDSETVLGLMPGSRRSEIKHHLRTQLETARIFLAQHPGARIALLVAPTLDRDFIREQIGEQMGQLNFSVQLIKESPLEMIDLSDVVLVASGTATLMVGLMKKPMVIMYRMNALSAWIAKRVVTKTPFFGMVNLVLGRCAVPELFQEQASAQALATELSKLVADSEERAKMIQDLVELREKLGSAGATDRVARILDAYL